jgi:LytS/YehU family sensor histidine kinase
VVFFVKRNKNNLQKQKEFYELNNRVKELEITVIKSQMNPHFISNSLAAIQNLIFTQKIEEAGQYLAKFSFFLRQVLDYSDKTLITLQEELEMVKLCLDLEQLRFTDNFSFELVVDPKINLSDVLTPSLITQPFIENAIWHGLIPLKDRNPKLTITVFLQKNYVMLVIEDNGVGREKNKSLISKSSRGMKIAMDKIESINRLQENLDHLIEVTDLYDERGLPSGTKVSIRLSTYNT